MISRVSVGRQTSSISLITRSGSAPGRSILFKTCYRISSVTKYAYMHHIWTFYLMIFYDFRKVMKKKYKKQFINLKRENPMPQNYTTV